MKAVIIFVKYPEPGKVKTRLGKTIGFDLAAELYRLFMLETFEFVRGLQATRVFVAFEPLEKRDHFEAIVPDGFECFAQQGNDLGERLIHAFEHVFAAGSEHVVAIGSDSPTLPVGYVRQAYSLLRQHDLVLGPAEDGGYYLIGLKQMHSALFRGVPWSSSSVLASTLAAAKKLNLKTAALSTWYDVDDMETLRRALDDEGNGAIAKVVQAHPGRFRKWQ